jgi:hypothetical protein
VKIEAEAKALEARAALHKNVVKAFAHEQYVTHLVGNGALPPTPTCVVTGSGESVTYVVQDRAGQYAAKDDQVEALAQILGEDVARNMVGEETTFSFDRLVLSLPGVLPAIQEALEGAVAKLTSEGPDGALPVLTQDQADQLIVADKKVTFRPGILDRLYQLVGADVNRMSATIDALGSSVTRYVKT